MTLRTTLSAAASILALCAPLAPALAQEDSQGAPETQLGENFTQDQLDSFVDAAMQVAELRQSYQAQMQAAGSDTARQELAQQATQEMRAAVNETEGMTVETYNAIGQAAQTDEALSERINAIAREKIPADQAPDEG